MRRVVLSGVAAVLVSLSCGPDFSGPSAGRLSNGIGFLTEFPSQVAGGSDLVPFTRVRIVLARSDETTALDTIVNYPATGELSLSLRVRLSPDAPSEGETLSMMLEYLNAAGDVVFRGGPTTVLAVPAGNTQTEPVSIPVEYVGLGANATQVVISEQAMSVLDGGAFTFTAVAQDGQGQPIAGTPIAWSSLEPAIATINAIGAGAGVAQNVRGTARIVARLLTGPADTVTVNVSLRASVITAVSGGGQSGGVGLALASPLVVRVTASDGVPVPGVAVTFAVTAGGGSLGTASTSTDASGLAQTTWQLGTLVGAQTVTASATGVAGNASFSATGTSVGATQLQFAVQPSTVTAGVPISPSLLVVATDAVGATVTSYTGPVTLSLGANPGGATLSGTLTVNAVAGVATFNNVRVNRNAAAYTLVASSPGLTNATSAGFTVLAAPPVAFNIVSGNAQAAAPSTQLAQPLVVSVTDSLGNGVPGIGVTWGPVFGGGSLGGAGTVTDASGRSSRTWTLGATTGSQSVDVQAPSLAAAVFFTATALPAGITKVWTGATDQAWTTGTNWSPAGVPVATDGVQIPSTLNQPVMSGPVTIASMFLLPGAGLDLGTTTLTVNGTLDASGFIFGSGSLILNGTGTLQGLITGNTQTLVQGTYTLSGGTGTGRLEVKGSLVFGGQVLSVSGPFLTADNGTITMNNADDGLSVSGSVFFGGGSEAGLLNFGVITVQGNFSQTAGTSATSFVASLNHTVVLAGTGPQSISFATPDTVTLSAVCAGSCFGGFAIANTGGAVTFNSAASARGDFSVVSAASVTAIGTDGNPRVITVAGSTTTVPGVPVQISRFRTTGDVFLDPSTVIDTIAFSGNPGQSVPGDATFGTVQFLGSPTLTGNLTVTGDLTVANGAASSAMLLLNGFRVDVGGNLVVTNGGTIDMFQPSDSLIVAGNAVFGGADVSGFMSGGVLAIGGNFTQLGVSTFTPSGPHKTLLNGTGLQTVSFADPVNSFFRRLFVEKTSGGVNFATNARAGLLRASTSITSTPPARVLADTLWGATGSSVTPFVFELTRVLADSGTFSPDTVVFLDGAPTLIQATGPGGFGSYIYKSIRTAKLLTTAVFAPVAITLQNDLVVSGGTLGIGGAQLTINGNFRTEGTGAFSMTGFADSVGVAGNVVFAGGSTAGILTNGVLTIGGNFSQSAFNSAFAPSLNHRTKFVGATPGFHTIQFANPTTSFFRDLILDKPTGSGQEIRLQSNVLVTDSMTVQNGTELTSATTQRLQVQGRFIYVGLNQPTVRPFVLELTTLAPALDSILPAPASPRFFPDTLVFTGAANYTLPFSNYTRLKSVRVSVGATNIVDMFGTGANDTLAGDMHVESGKLRLTSGNYVVRKLRTTNTGHMEMSGGAPVIVARDSIIFAGGTPNPLLNSGTIRAEGHFVQSNATSDASFNADPPHTVEFAGTSVQNISFASPGYTAALSHFGNLRITNPAGVNFQSDVLTHVLVDQTPGAQEKVIGNGFKFTAEGVNVRNMLFDNTLVNIVDNQPITVFDTVTFANYPGTPTILFVSRSAIFPKFNGLVFPETGFNGRYLFLAAPINVNLVLDQAIPAGELTNIGLYACTGGGIIIWNGFRLQGGSGC